MPRSVDLGTGYAIKRLLLGRPLATSRLEHERLGKPTALAVFSSDNMSSVAYATEEILRVLIPTVGVIAFTLVLPISFAIVLIEAILIFSYRQTIKAYPTAGGAYIVTKDNLGLLPAQLAGVALLIDYVLTVSVSTAAGVQAISSVVPLAVPLRIVLSLVFVWTIAYGNLLGVRESGRIFALPTFLFIVSLGLTCVAGIYQVVTGHLQAYPIGPQEASGGLRLGTAAVTAFLVLKAFASGGAAVTGVEAISNGVPAFRKPEWRNAQTTLVWMGLILGSTFLAVSYLAQKLQVIPVKDESKSVLAQIAQGVYGSGPLGHLLFLVLQIATTLILVLAANTSFADFPRLASFHAGDAFMPRQLTKRGHRLVFSNGIVALAGAASLIIVVFRASVTAMIPLYALGVFTSFTLSQTGMAKRHLRLREKGWRFGLFVNGLGAVATLRRRRRDRHREVRERRVHRDDRRPHPRRDPRPCEQDLRSGGRAARDRAGGTCGGRRPARTAHGPDPRRRPQRGSAARRAVCADDPSDHGARTAPRRRGPRPCPCMGGFGAPDPADGACLGRAAGSNDRSLRPRARDR